MKTPLAGTSRNLLDPLLLYSAQFTNDDSAMVRVNKINAAPLTVERSGENGQQHPLAQPIGQAGLRINVAKDAAQKSVVFHTSLSPWAPTPSKLPTRFTLVGEFFLPQDFQLPAGSAPGSSPDGVRWAAVVGIRNTDNLDVDMDTDGEPDLRLAGATHQVRNFAGDAGGRIALNTGNGTQPPVPAADFVSPAVAYPPGVSERRFRLETHIDLDNRRGVSRLRTIGKTWNDRSWMFQPDFGQPTAVCFGLAMNAGRATVSVIATSFRIYRIPPGLWGQSVLDLHSDAAFDDSTRGVARTRQS